MKCAAAVLVLVLVLVQAVDSVSIELDYEVGMRQYVGGLIAAQCDDWAPAKPCEEDGWFWMNSTTCIKLFDEAETFDEAEQSCVEEHSGHLVSMHGLRDYYQVLCMLYRANKADVEQVWVGLVKEEGSSTFHFTDGTSLDFYRWLPTASTDERVCIRINYRFWGHWSGQDCSEELPYVCEKKM